MGKMPNEVQGFHSRLDGALRGNGPSMQSHRSAEESLGLVMSSRQMARYAQEMALAEKSGAAWRESEAFQKHTTQKTQFAAAVARRMEGAE